MAGMRDVVAHQYDRVRLETTWQAVQAELPAIATRIAQLEDAGRRQEEGDEGQ